MSPAPGRWIETPEGAQLPLVTAGFVVRFYAWTIDLLLRGAFYVATLIPLAYLGDLGSGLIFLILFAGEWFYPVLFEVWNDGATPGKRLLGIAVVHADGTPVELGASALRNLVRIIDLLPGTYTLGLISVILNRHDQRLGDIVAGTWVVHRHPAPAAPPVPPAPPIPPGRPLAADERHAILAYAERYGSLAPQRAEALARLALPSAVPAAPRLLGIARWLRGDRP